MPSRQYLWQMKQQAKGNCIICGKLRVHYRYRCDDCTVKQRTAARRREKNRAENAASNPGEQPALAMPRLGQASPVATELSAMHRSLPER
jgi:hypothetical protein